jgi:hypothetical protein
MTKARFERLTIILAGVVLSYGIFAYQWTTSVTSLSPLLSTALTLLTSAGLFRLLLLVCYGIVSRSDVLMTMYLGPKRFWRGYWHYTSINDGKLHLGIWHVEQAVRDTSVFACGLDEDYRRRFEAPSITDPIEYPDGVFEVIYGFESNADAGRRIFAKTRVKPDQPQGSWYRGRRPLILRGKTFTYGGPNSESEFTNVRYVRHPDVTSEDELIAELRREGIRHGGAASEGEIDALEVG